MFGRRFLILLIICLEHSALHLIKSAVHWQLPINKIVHHICLKDKENISVFNLQSHEFSDICKKQKISFQNWKEQLKKINERGGGGIFLSKLSKVGHYVFLALREKKKINR